MERLADRYELGDALGQGRSTVYRAVDTRLRRDVAIKRVQLLAGTEDAEQVRTRALREAQAAARLNDPHVVSVYDVIEESGAIWLVMELVDGPSVARIVDDDGPLTHERAATVGLGVLTALEAAHQVGVVHRDVKPANVLVCDGDRTKLTDFGVATIRDESRLTATGLIVGSPSYMAPEQANAGAITPATDMWALGALLYFAVEGEAPFLEPTPLATATAVVHGEPRVPARPGPLTPLVTRLLTKDPARRPPAAEVRAVLVGAAWSTAPTPSSAEATAVHHGVAPVPPDEPGLPAAPGDAAPGATGVSGGAGGAGGRSGAGVPPAPSLDRPDRRYRRQLVVGAAGAALALAVTAAALRDDDGGGGTAREGTTQTTSPDGQAAPGDGDPGGEGDTAATTTEAATTTTGDAGGLPEGWTPFTDPEGTYTIGLPPGWEVRRTGAAYRLDLVDPESGSFLRVEWTDSPRSDVVGDWRAQAESFESRNASYREIDIAPVDYRDYDAALWEFTHTSGGETLHTGNLGFVADGRGYALMFRTPERLWDDGQPLLEQFRQAFQPS